jgi:hypothetical protein
MRSVLQAGAPRRPFIQDQIAGHPLAKSEPGFDNSGLCQTCIFARVIESARGSRFSLCRRSETDARFPRYPALPVLESAGYEKGAPANDAQIRNVNSP